MRKCAAQGYYIPPAHLRTLRRRNLRTNLRTGRARRALPDPRTTLRTCAGPTTLSHPPERLAMLTRPDPTPADELEALAAEVRRLLTGASVTPQLHC